VRPVSGETDALLEVRALEVAYPVSRPLLGRGEGLVRAVDGVSFELSRGETLGLVGESGCGKSTLARAIVRLVRPSAGTVRLGGSELTALEGERLRHERRRLQMIFQDPYSSLNPRLAVGAIVAEPLEVHGLGTRRDRRRRVAELLERVGLAPSAATRFPHQFSGGQRQRIGIARALALDPEVVIADEPVSALDVSIQAQIMNLLKRLQRELSLTYLFIAHDLAAVRHVSDRVMVMYLGSVVESAPVRALFLAPRHPYTVALLSAAPLPDPEREARRRRIILPGEVPSPANPPSGCRFHPRCWLRARLGEPRECVEARPVLRPAGPGHAVACHFAEAVADAPEQHQVRAVTGSGSSAGEPR